MPGGHPHWGEPLWENTQEEPCGVVPVAVVLAVVTVAVVLAVVTEAEAEEDGRGGGGLGKN